MFFVFLYIPLIWPHIIICADTAPASTDRESEYGPQRGTGPQGRSPAHKGVGPIGSCPVVNKTRFARSFVRTSFARKTTTTKTPPGIAIDI
jgi:hypothetical protein